MTTSRDSNQQHKVWLYPNLRVDQAGIRPHPLSLLSLSTLIVHHHTNQTYKLFLSQVLFLSSSLFGKLSLYFLLVPLFFFRSPLAFIVIQLGFSMLPQLGRSSSKGTEG